MSPWILGFTAATGAGGPNFELIQTHSISADVTNVSFLNIEELLPYKHLQIRSVAHGIDINDSGSASHELRFNGDTASNYSHHTMQGNSSSVSTIGSNSADSISLQNYVPRTSGTADKGFLIMDILNFNDENKYTTVRSLSGVALSNSPASSYSFVSLGEGSWHSTAKIDTIDFGVNGNGFAANSRISLYGIRG